ncbi:signal transduction histidine kinase [Actinoplanes xinjiangensis]|uniref:histidine kinase n=1 Tax=Actinoplanes xinjiangensis TaxID=512350 RepID=A0A316FSL4_9ACTN|nr:signal transduction histidine kinase [Actinoplanes xinjiangensis]GIF39794.1 histidine kinase [Actinoplanes xinjiangensis]
MSLNGWAGPLAAGYREPVLIDDLKDRRYLLTARPWWSLLHLAVTAVLAAPVAFGFWMLMLPWLVAGQDVTEGREPPAAVVVLILTSAFLFAAAGPAVALPLAAVERRRLRLPAPHRPLMSGPVAWFVARYREESTWRAVAYAVLLALAAPLLVLGATLLAVVEAVLLFSPWIAEWRLGDLVIHGGPESVPFMFLGLAGLPLVLYLAGAVAALHTALARRLLGGTDVLRDQLTEVSLSRARLVDAFDAERRRIERDLHDGAQHRLTSLTLQLGMARLDLPGDSPAAEPLGRAHDQAKELMVVLRDLVHGIRPQTLADLGLPAALWELAANSPVPVAVDADAIAGRLPERVETTAYFVAAEALTNVAKHARAASVQVRLTRSGEAIVLEILDDGRGGADPARGSGLTGLADRVAAAGGKLLLASPSGGPTLLRVEL